MVSPCFFILSISISTLLLALLNAFIIDFDNDLSKSITIKNNTLRIFTFAELTRSSSSSIYIFRYQNNRFELIGLEIRSGGNSSYTDYESFVASINFSTKKLIKTKETGKYDSDEKSKIDKKEKTININKNYILENMTEETANEILEKYGN